MSQLHPEYVKRGFWVNVPHGPIMGQTITTDVRTGSLVVALLAVLTTFGLGHLWNVFLFCYHQFRARGRSSEGHFHQQQALLRTLPPPNAITSSWIKLWWVWKDKADSAFVCTWVLALLSVVFTAATIAVGIFVSYVVSSTNVEVLVKSPFCGPFDLGRYLLASTAASTDSLGFLDYQADLSTSSRTYSRACYQNTSVQSAQCSTYIRSSIPFTSTREECPYANMCGNISQPAISFDSGLIDVNHGFGLNLHPHDAFKFRRKNTCALLDTKDRYSSWNETYGPSQQVQFEEYIGLNYGSSTDQGWNYTFLVSYFKANNSLNYKALAANTYLNIPSWTNLDPLPELQTSDADLSINGILKNQVIYSQPVDDPMFAAHKPWSNPNWLPENYYISDFVASILACTEQYQFCFRQSNGSDYCTDLTGITTNASTADYPGASAVQLATMRLLQASALMMNTPGAINTGIQAADLLDSSGIIHYLPDDQWVQELIGWESHVWAGLQYGVADHAIGSTARGGGEASLQSNETDIGERQLCGSQRMRMAGGFANINVFALAFVIASTCTFTLLDILLLRLLIYTRRFRHILAPRIDRWIQDGVFQLQRRAYEAQEEVAWGRSDKEIPVTAGNVQLPVLSTHMHPQVGVARQCTCESGQSTYTARSSGAVERVQMYFKTKTFSAETVVDDRIYPLEKKEIYPQENKEPYSREKKEPWPQEKKEPWPQEKKGELR